MCVDKLDTDRDIGHLVVTRKKKMLNMSCLVTKWSIAPPNWNVYTIVYVLMYASYGHRGAFVAPTNTTFWSPVGRYHLKEGVHTSEIVI